MPASETIVLCFDATDSQVEQITRLAGNARVVASSQQDIAVDIFDADMFFGHAKVPIDWAKVVGAGRLKWIQSSAAGLDHCLVPEVVESEIVVSGCSGLFANQVAEQTLALLLGCLRRIPEFIAAQQKQIYRRLATETLFDRKVSILGFGGNGRRIASVLLPFGCSILASDLFPKFERLKDVEVIPAGEIDRLFEFGDIVINTLPLTDQTIGAVCADQFKLLGSGGIFINVGRGRTVDHDALLDWLAGENGGYAGLDVVDPEPLPNGHSLWTNDRILITPHVGAQSPHRNSDTIELFRWNLQRWQKGQTLINLVDKQKRLPLPQHRLHRDDRGQIVLPEI